MLREGEDVSDCMAHFRSALGVEGFVLASNMGTVFGVS